MARGGRRQGRQGVGYSNRTDLLTNRAPASGSNTPASGPFEQGGVHSVNTPAAPAAPQTPAITPDDTVSLFDPGTPGTPLTAGLPVGAGPGPAPTPPADESAIIRAYLPSLQRVATREGTPDSFKALVRRLQGL